MNGLQKQPTDVSTKQKRWADTKGIQTINALHVPNSRPATTLHSEENAEDYDDFQSKEDKEYRAVSEKEKSRISWNIERNVFLSQASNQA